MTQWQDRDKLQYSIFKQKQITSLLAWSDNYKNDLRLYNRRKKELNTSHLYGPSIHGWYCSFNKFLNILTSSHDESIRSLNSDLIFAKLLQVKGRLIWKKANITLHASRRKKNSAKTNTFLLFKISTLVEQITNICRVFSFI